MKKKKGKKPTEKTPPPRRGGEEKRIRHKIEEALLAERLGLNDDWIDRWEEDGECKEESFAPNELPEFIQAQIEEQLNDDHQITRYGRKELVKEYLDSVNEAVEQLVTAGCRKQVIYFCLNELSPEAERRRLPSRPIDAPKSPKPGGSPPGGRLEDELDIPVPPPPKKLAQRQELGELPSLARRVKRLIHRYRKELWLVAHAVERRNNWQKVRRLARAAQEGQNPPATEPDFGEGMDLPSSLLTKLTFPEDALSLVESSLLWVVELAKIYTAPFEKRVLQSKGFIALTAYVDMYADLSKFRGKGHSGRGNPLSVLTSLVGQEDWSPSYLKVKLQKFKGDFPDLYDLLMNKLEELHKFHSPI